ncbi:MAG: HEAT repeat domain-containing protein [Planctomycetes bacterium]|nr:HEAT repeat domain-containing protein [Planctomycetota bacterium]
MKHGVVSMIAIATLASIAWPGCWNAIDPGAFAQDCPIILAGTIESVAQAKPGGFRSDDVARIRVTAIHRNELTDVALKPGDLFLVKMISRNNNQRTSTDINYPVKTKAVWLVMLTSKGEFRIDVHPVQKQPFQERLKLRLQQQDQQKRAGAEPSKLANPRGTKTTAQWVAWKKDQEARHARALAAYFARQKAIRDLAKAFADASTLDAALWKRFDESDLEVRRGMLQLTLYEQPMSGPRFAEVAQGVLLREKDDNVRTHAVSQLAYCRDPGVKGMEVLAAALRDKSAGVRLFACQSVKMRRYEKLAEQVRALQNDPDKQVRAMATHTLETWRKK